MVFTNGVYMSIKKMQKENFNIELFHQSSSDVTGDQCLFRSCSVNMRSVEAETTEL